MPAGLIVSVTVAVLLRLPEAPVTVIGNVPVVAATLTERVSELLVVAGFGAKEAVTPLGNPDAEKVTLPLNPFCGVTVMVLEPDAP